MAVTRSENFKNREHVNNMKYYIKVVEEQLNISKQYSHLHSSKYKKIEVLLLN
jgi:hypothetical protein